MIITMTVRRRCEKRTEVTTHALNESWHVEVDENLSSG